jgi:predicted nucleic acid-binding protein
VSGPSAVVDTNIFVSAWNRREAGSDACRRLLDRIDEGSVRALVSTITIAEIRAGLRPAESRSVWQAFVSHLLTSPNYHVEPVDVTIAEMAGELRESSRITLPDALIVATGRSRDADCVVTLDRELARQQNLLRARRPEEVR